MQFPLIYALVVFFAVVIIFLLYLIRTFNSDTPRAGSESEALKQSIHLDIGIEAGFKFGIGFALALITVFFVIFIIFISLIGSSTQMLFG